jgi:hypothetical protein
MLGLLYHHYCLTCHTLMFKVCYTAALSRKVHSTILVGGKFVSQMDRMETDLGEWSVYWGNVISDGE